MTSRPVAAHRLPRGIADVREEAEAPLLAGYERFREDVAAMSRFETASLALMPGQRVRVKVVSHQRWGVIAQIVGHEQVGASIDMIEQFGRTAPGDELQALYPRVGTEIDAVVEQVQRWHPPVWVRLSIRRVDLESLQRPCDFCGQPTNLSPGGDDLVLDVRSNEGPGSVTVISHRTCLADRITPENIGERARTLRIGRATDFTRPA